MQAYTHTATNDAEGFYEHCQRLSDCGKPPRARHNDNECRWYDVCDGKEERGQLCQHHLLFAHKKKIPHKVDANSTQNLGRKVLSSEFFRLAHRAPTPMLLLLGLHPCSGACPYNCTGRTCHIVQTMPKQPCTAWAVANQYVAYLKIPKASSTTSMTSLVRSHADYVLRPLHQSTNGLDKLRCVFTFVRDPIERFISGYRELISRISKAEDGSNFTSDRSWPFWNVSHEPARFRQFVDDLLLSGDQMTCFGHISHAVSQTNYLQRFATLLPTMVPFFWAAMDAGSDGETQRQRMFAAVRGQCGADISHVLAHHLNPGSNKNIPSLSNTSQVREQFLDAETSSKVHWLLRDDIRCFGYDRG